MKKTTTDLMKIAVGIAILLAFLFINGAVIFIPELSDNSLAHLLIGEVMGALITLVSFYYGSSKSSQDKDKKVIK